MSASQLFRLRGSYRAHVAASCEITSAVDGEHAPRRALLRLLIDWWPDVVLLVRSIRRRSSVDHDQ